MEFALISVCSVLHFFDFESAQFIIDRLTSLLLPRGWIITQNHHVDHLYSKNPKILGQQGFYKHFFSEKDLPRLFPQRLFSEKFLAVENLDVTEKEKAIAGYLWSLCLDLTRE